VVAIQRLPLLNTKCAWRDLGWWLLTGGRYHKFGCTLKMHQHAVNSRQKRESELVSRVIQNILANFFPHMTLEAY
jgi:hypothetical protein